VYASFANLSRQKLEVLEKSQADAGYSYSDNSRTELIRRAYDVRRGPYENQSGQISRSKNRKRSHVRLLNLKIYISVFWVTWPRVLVNVRRSISEACCFHFQDKRTHTKSKLDNNVWRDTDVGVKVNSDCWCRNSGWLRK
jgi:hypothetical protein